MYSSAPRQQQLADELWPEVSTLVALVQATRPATARQACTTVESLAESLQEAFDPLALPLLPPLLLVASGSTPAVARAAEGCVITIVRSCGPQRKTALLCWAAAGLASGGWEEAPDFRSAPDAIVRRQSLWLVLMLLELAEADDAVEIEALARQLSDALDIAELSKRAETRAIGQHARTVLQRRLARSGHAPVAPNFSRAQPQRAASRVKAAAASRSATSTRRFDPLRSVVGSSVRPSFYESYVSPYDQGLLRQKGCDAPPPPRRRQSNASASESAGGMVPGSGFMQSMGPQAAADMTAMSSATGGLRTTGALFAAQEEDPRAGREEERSQTRRMQAVEARRFSAEEQLAAARRELLEFRAQAEVGRRAAAEAQQVKSHVASSAAAEDWAGLPSWSQALGLPASETQLSPAAAQQLPRVSSRRHASECSPLPHGQIAPPPPTPPRAEPTASAQWDVEMSPAPSNIGMAIPQPTAFEDSSGSFSLQAPPMTVASSRVEVVIRHPGPLGLSMDEDTAGRLLVVDVKADGGPNAAALAPLRDGHWELVAVGGTAAERRSKLEIMPKLRDSARPLSLTFAPVGIGGFLAAADGSLLARNKAAAAATAAAQAAADARRASANRIVPPVEQWHSAAQGIIPALEPEPEPEPPMQAWAAAPEHYEPLSPEFQALRSRISVPEDLLTEMDHQPPMPQHRPDSESVGKAATKKKKKKKKKNKRKKAKPQPHQGAWGGVPNQAQFGAGYTKRYTARLRRERQDYEQKRTQHFEVAEYDDSTDEEGFEQSDMDFETGPDSMPNSPLRDGGGGETGGETRRPTAREALAWALASGRTNPPRESARSTAATKAKEKPAASTSDGKLRAKYLNSETARAISSNSSGKEKAKKKTSRNPAKEPVEKDFSVALGLLEKLRSSPQVLTLLDGLGVSEATDFGLLDEYDLAALANHCPKVTFHKLAAEWSEQRAVVLAGTVGASKAEVRAVALERLADALVEEAEAQAAHEQRQQLPAQEQAQELRVEEVEEAQSAQLGVSDKLAALRQSEAFRRARAESQHSAEMDAPTAAAAAPQREIPAGGLRSTPTNRSVARTVPAAGAAATTEQKTHQSVAVGKLRESPAKRTVVRASGGGAELPAGDSRASPRAWDESTMTP